MCCIVRDIYIILIKSNNYAILLSLHYPTLLISEPYVWHASYTRDTFCALGRTTRTTRPLLSADRGHPYPGLIYILMRIRRELSINRPSPRACSVVVWSTSCQQQVAAINYCNNLCNLDTILTHLLQQLILEVLEAAGVRSLH